MTMQDYTKEELEKLLVNYTESVHKMLLTFVLSFCKGNSYEEYKEFLLPYRDLDQTELSKAIADKIQSTVAAEQSWRDACDTLSKDLERINNDSTRFLEK